MKQQKQNSIYRLILGAIFVVATLVLLMIADEKGLISIQNNPLLIFIPAILFFYISFSLIKLYISECLPCKYADLRKGIFERPLKKCRVYGKFGRVDCRGTRLMIECFSSCFIVSFFGYCDKFSYSPIILEKVFLGYTMKTKTTTGAEITLYIGKELYVFLKNKKIRQL